MGLKPASATRGENTCCERGAVTRLGDIHDKRTKASPQQD
jgi:hypothetical protein